jgi:hypothetical protein
MPDDLARMIPLPVRMVAEELARTYRVVVSVVCRRCGAVSVETHGFPEASRPPAGWYHYRDHASPANHIFEGSCLRRYCPGGCEMPF